MLSMVNLKIKLATRGGRRQGHFVSFMAGRTRCAFLWTGSSVLWAPATPGHYPLATPGATPTHRPPSWPWRLVWPWHHFASPSSEVPGPGQNVNGQGVPSSCQGVRAVARWENEDEKERRGHVLTLPLFCAPASLLANARFGVLFTESGVFDGPLCCHCGTVRGTMNTTGHGRG